MGRGARSIRGAMGTYAWVAAGLLVVLGLVLWGGPAWTPPLVRVQLAADSGLRGAVLTGEQGSYEISGAGFLELLPGVYQVRLFTAAGQTVQRRVELRGTSVELASD